jgi:hypothetical protein
MFYLFKIAAVSRSDVRFTIIYTVQNKRRMYSIGDIDPKSDLRPPSESLVIWLLLFFGRLCGSAGSVCTDSPSDREATPVGRPRAGPGPASSSRGAREVSLSWIRMDSDGLGRTLMGGLAGPVGRFRMDFKLDSDHESDVRD